MDDIARHLLPGERVLWRGKPATGLILRPIEAFLIPFSLLWGGFALFWNVAVWTSDTADLPFRLFGLPFLVAGLYVTVGRLLLDAYLRRRLTYVVSDRRILILRRGSGSAARSIDIRRLPALELDERRDGTGTLRFGASGNWLNGGNFGIWQPTFDATPQFLRIDQVRSVYTLIQQHAG